MPSAVTHAFVGASLVTLAPAYARTASFGLVLALLAVAPDLDIIAFRLGIPYSHPLGHRGFSHSLAFALLVALLSGPLLRAWTRGRAAEAGPRLALLVFVAVASHGLLDAFTDAGLGVGFFVPLSDARHFFPWRPILTSSVDPAAFFSARGAAILANEMSWVWLPVGVALGGVAWLRRRREASNARAPGPGPRSS